VLAAADQARSSLERLEHLTLASVTLGFSLLTIGTVTGVVRYIEEGGRTPAAKIVLALAVWMVYAVVLHSPMNPSFRGRKAAVLSVVGFVADDGIGIDVGQQHIGTLQVVSLSGCEVEAGRIAQGIDGRARRGERSGRSVPSR